MAWGGRYELRRSRQKLILDGTVDQNWFQNFNTLDNSSSNLRAEWGWQAGNYWEGTLGAGYRHYLENFGSVQQNIRDMIDRISTYGSANFRPLSYLKFRKTDAAYPNDAVFSGASLDNSYTENEYSLVAVWNVTAASLLRGRLGRTERTFDQDASRDFSGPTWRLGYEWTPTGKTALELATWRELTGFEDFSGNYMRTTGIGRVVGNAQTRPAGQSALPGSRLYRQFRLHPHCRAAEGSGAAVPGRSGMDAAQIDQPNLRCRNGRQEIQSSLGGLRLPIIEPISNSHILRNTLPDEPRAEI